MDTGLLMSNIPEIRWRGPCDMSGYGNACIGYVTGLAKGGLRVRLVDKSMSVNLSGRGMDENIQSILEELQKTPISKTAPTVQHQVADLMKPSPTAIKNIGFTIFEMTTVPPKWVKQCEKMDQIWTGSEYSKEAFVASGLRNDKIHVVPHVIDTEWFRPDVDKITLPRKAAINFLSVFDFQERKAWRELLTAYARAFKAKDDVCLWLKCYQNGFSKEDQAALIARIYRFMGDLAISNIPRIEVCPFDIPHSLMPSFYAAFDCYVSIAREGFGLPFAEAGAAGLAVIGPEVGGVREFLTPENSFLINYVEDRPISQEMLRINPTFVNLKWATHDIEHLEHTFKYVAEHPEEMRQKGFKVRETIQHKLSYNTITEIVRKLLEL